VVFAIPVFKEIRPLPTLAMDIEDTDIA